MHYSAETAILLELLHMADNSSLLSAVQKHLLRPIKKSWLH